MTELASGGHVNVDMSSGSDSPEGRHRMTRFWIFAAAAVLAACTGEIGGKIDQPGSSTGQPPGSIGGSSGHPGQSSTTPMDQCTPERSLAPARLSLLSD